MNKLICIVGSTATGKTAKALSLAAIQPSILVSADSRQVYRTMDIVTGKDHPQDIIIYGIDIVDPDEPCSVAVWYDAVIPHINGAWDTGKQVIVVGGTGLYVKAITQGIPTMSVPPNQPLRDKLAALTVAELQDKLKQLDEAKFTSMNHSDQNNSRRLIRAIEISSYSNKVPNLVKQSSELSEVQAEIIGLDYSDLSIQRNKIYERVLARLKLGAIVETKKLLQKYDSSLPSMSAIGYKSIIAYIENQIDETTMINTWVNDELAYAKRQLTWFRPTKNIKWYDIDTS